MHIFCNETAARASYRGKRGESVTDFEQVYTQYFGGVYQYLMSLCRSEALAQELTQETFFKAMRQIEGFKGECKLYVWLCQIAKNTYFSYLRKEKRCEAPEEVPEQADEAGLEEAVVQSDTAFSVHRALHAMPEPYKEVLTLRIFGELSFAQIGELFGKTESWARVTYHRGKIKLKETLL